MSLVTFAMSWTIKSLSLTLNTLLSLLEVTCAFHALQLKVHLLAAKNITYYLSIMQSKICMSLVTMDGHIFPIEIIITFLKIIIIGRIEQLNFVVLIYVLVERTK